MYREAPRAHRNGDGLPGANPGGSRSGFGDAGGSSPRPRPAVITTEFHRIPSRIGNGPQGSTASADPPVGSRARIARMIGTILGVELTVFEFLLIAATFAAMLLGGMLTGRILTRALRLAGAKRRR